MRSRAAFVLWLLVFAAIPAFAQGEREAVPEPTHRLVLDGGKSYEVYGLERKNGLLLFRDEKGVLSSIKESQVREVVVLDARAEEAPAAEPPETPAAPGGGDAMFRYTNTDLAPLPPAPEAAPEAPEAPDAPVDTVDPAAPEAPEAPPSFAVPLPTEIDGKPESWWRGEIGRLRLEIEDLQAEEDEVYRLWVCAMHDIPLTGGRCAPQVNQLPPVNRTPRTPTQRSVNDQLVDVRSRKAVARDELEAFIDQAIGSGVPTPWLLEDAPREAAGGEEAAETVETDEEDSGTDDEAGEDAESAEEEATAE